MKRFLKLLASIFFFIGLSARAAECTHYWQTLLSTDPSVPKGMSGDGNAAYGVLSFEATASTKLVIKGEFPNARFMSLSTVKGKRHHPQDAVEDYKIKPDEGSVNPFVEGAPMDAPNRAFTLEAIPFTNAQPKVNQLRFPSKGSMHAFMYRIFSPNSGVKILGSDFPRVFAYDARTNQPKHCPRPLPQDMYYHFPQFLGLIVHYKPSFDFRLRSINWGPNSAIPQYAYGVNPMRQGEEVLVTRLKVPNFVNSFPGKGPFPRSSEVRFWSFCAENFANDESLGCVPDYLAQVGADGIATFVYGQGDDVRDTAQRRGYNFIKDVRKSNQFIAGLVYRNLLPEAEFAKTTMHQGAYLPRAVQCTREEFLSDDCG